MPLYPSPVCRPSNDLLRRGIVCYTLSVDDISPITAAQAEELLNGLPLVPAMAGSIQEMKNLRDKCLAAGIPALVGCPGGTKG